MKKNQKIFLFEIEILNNEWDYKKGQIIFVPVQSSTSYHADLKFDNECNGSEYPPYNILKIHKCDNFLFKPIL